MLFSLEKNDSSSQQNGHSYMKKTEKREFKSVRICRMYKCLKLPIRWMRTRMPNLNDSLTRCQQQMEKNCTVTPLSLLEGLWSET